MEQNTSPHYSTARSLVLRCYNSGNFKDSLVAMPVKLIPACGIENATYANDAEFLSFRYYMWKIVP